MTVTDSMPVETAAILRRIAAARCEPPADLWMRIEATHIARTRRRRLRRLAAGMLGVVLVGAVALSVRLPPATTDRNVEIDWQARAQALELQLQAIGYPRPTPVTAASDADPLTIELAEVDRRLQAAYEHKLHANQLAPLWKRRSELLDALIATRKQGLTLTRI